jgi:hypothetical protein
MARGLTSAAFVERLQAKGLHEDAMVFVAFVLPPRPLLIRPKRL